MFDVLMTSRTTSSILLPYYHCYTSFSVNTSTTTDDQDINTLSYTWDFGDGSLGQSGTGLTSVNHTYSATGIYIITVTAEVGGEPQG